MFKFQTAAGGRYFHAIIRLTFSGKSSFTFGPLIFPNARERHLYLTLSEVMGNLEVLEAEGRVARSERAGTIRFEKVS